MDDGFFLNQWTTAQLTQQVNYYSQFSSANASVSCFIPPVSIPFRQSAQRRGYLSYYGVNTNPNFVILDYTKDNLASAEYYWRALLISGSVLIGVSFLGGLLVFLWWFCFLRSLEEEESKVIQFNSKVLLDNTNVLVLIETRYKGL